MFLFPPERGQTLKGNNLLPMVYSKRKEFAPPGSKGSKFFPFRVDPSPEDGWFAGMQTGSHKIVSLVKNG